MMKVCIDNWPIISFCPALKDGNDERVETAWCGLGVFPTIDITEWPLSAVGSNTLRVRLAIKDWELPDSCPHAEALKKALTDKGRLVFIDA